MNVDTVIIFSINNRQSADYLYLLLDPLAIRDASDALSIASLAQTLGESSIMRVLRPDLAHDPESCPLLVQLAAPAENAPRQLLELSAAQAKDEIDHNRRYVCGWLLSEQPLAVVAAHLVQRCHDLRYRRESVITPWFEPLRLELLEASVPYRFRSFLGAIREWLYPLSWGLARVFPGGNTADSLEITDLAREGQSSALLVNTMLIIWQQAIERQMRYAPWRWTGDSPLPPHAATHAFRLVRDARRQGLSSEFDIISLCMHRVLIHPHLPRHPTVQQDIAAAAAGQQALQARFESYSDAKWQDIFRSLPQATDYL